MAKHFLLLDVPDTYVEEVFLLNDVSVYTSSLPVTCQNLQITPPGYNSPTIIDPTQQNFKLVLNACTLGITSPGGCNDICPAIPDGIFNIWYSVAPNDKVWVEYQYLRITHAVNVLNQALCSLNAPCCLPDQELQYELKNIDIIRNFLISAQVNINNFHQPVDGMNQYRYALSLLEKMTRRKPNCVSY